MWRAREGDAIVAEVAVGVGEGDAAEDLRSLLLDEGSVRGAGEDRRVVDVAHAHVHRLGGGGGGGVLDLGMVGAGVRVRVGVRFRVKVRIRVKVRVRVRVRVRDRGQVRAVASLTSYSKVSG